MNKTAKKSNIKKKKKYQLVELREDYAILMKTDAHQQDFDERIFVQRRDNSE